MHKFFVVAKLAILPDESRSSWSTSASLVRLDVNVWFSKIFLIFFWSFSVPPATVAALSQPSSPQGSELASAELIHLMWRSETSLSCWSVRLAGRDCLLDVSWGDRMGDKPSKPLDVLWETSRIEEWVGEGRGEEFFGTVEVKWLEFGDRFRGLLVDPTRVCL